MSCLSRFRRTFLRDQRGISAVEFALISPFFLAMIVGYMEITFRYQTSDKFSRVAAQAGDYFSRSSQLTSDDIEDFFERSDDLMRPVIATGKLSLTVSSICLKEEDDGEASLLWKRAHGSQVFEIDPKSAVGLGDPGETVIRVDTSYDYVSPVSELTGGKPATLTKTVFYRPRVTRAVAVDGNLGENGDDCFYSAPVSTPPPDDDDDDDAGKTCPHGRDGSDGNCAKEPGGGPPGEN